jgi:hypothetical protein
LRRVSTQTDFKDQPVAFSECYLRGSRTKLAVSLCRIADFNVVSREGQEGLERGTVPRPNADRRVEIVERVLFYRQNLPLDGLRCDGLCVKWAGDVLLQEQVSICLVEFT